jgi:hypothetical protein
VSGVEDCAFFLLREGQRSHLGIARWVDYTLLLDGVLLREYFARHAGKRACRQGVLHCARRDSFAGVDLLGAIFSFSARSIERNSPISAPGRSNWFIAFSHGCCGRRADFDPSPPLAQSFRLGTTAC